jgi:hypothetical protein
MVHRAGPHLPVEVALTPQEIQRLEQLVKDTAKTSTAEPLTRYAIKLAQLGGYLARANDLPPGSTVIWRGLRRLVDIQLGFELATKLWVIARTKDRIPCTEGISRRDRAPSPCRC